MVSSTEYSHSAETIKQSPSIANSSIAYLEVELEEHKRELDELAQLVERGETVAPIQAMLYRIVDRRKGAMRTIKHLRSDIPDDSLTPEESAKQRDKFNYLHAEYRDLMIKCLSENGRKMGVGSYSFNGDNLTITFGEPELR